MVPNIQANAGWGLLEKGFSEAGRKFSVLTGRKVGYIGYLQVSNLIYPKTPFPSAAKDASYRPGL